MLRCGLSLRTAHRSLLNTTITTNANLNIEPVGTPQHTYGSHINGMPGYLERNIDPEHYPMLMNASKEELQLASLRMKSSESLLEVVKPGPAYFVTDPVMALHRPEDLMPGHPDTASRLDAIYAAVRSNIDRLEGLEFAHPGDIPRLGLRDLLRVHDEDLVRTLLQWDGATRKVDNDLAITPHSVRASLRACDCVAHAIDLVTQPPTTAPLLDGPANPTPSSSNDSPRDASPSRPLYEVCGRPAPEGNPFAGQPVRRAFCAVRPGGHHSERDRALGMGLFNSVAVGVARALASGRSKRTLILDLDTFAGNGLADIFGSDQRVVTASVHAMPHYPYSGFYDQGGRGAAAGHVINMQTDTSASVQEWFASLSTMMPLVLEQFEADLVVVPFSFSQHVDDPLSPLRFTDADFVTLASAAMQVASAHVARDVPIVFVLEGGYSPDVLARCVPLTLRTILGHQQPPPLPTNIDRYTEGMLTALMQHHQHNWAPIRRKVLQENRVSIGAFEEYKNYAFGTSSRAMPEYTNDERAWDTRDRPLEQLDGMVRRQRLARTLTDPNITPTMDTMSRASRHVDDPTTHAAPGGLEAPFPFANLNDPRLQGHFDGLNASLASEAARPKFKTVAQEAAAIRGIDDQRAQGVASGPAVYGGVPRGKELNTSFQD